MHGRIHPEPIHTKIYPVIRNFFKFLLYCRAFQIQIRHFRPEGSLIPPAAASRHCIVGCSLLLVRKMIIIHIRTHRIVRFFSCLQTCKILTCLCKPWMLGRTVIHCHINDQPDTFFMTRTCQLFKIIRRTICLVHRFVIRCIIFMIGWGRHDRHEPDSVASQI